MRSYFLRVTVLVLPESPYVLRHQSWNWRYMSRSLSMCRSRPPAGCARSAHQSPGRESGGPAGVRWGGGGPGGGGGPAGAAGSPVPPGPGLSKRPRPCRALLGVLAMGLYRRAAGTFPTASGSQGWAAALRPRARGAGSPMLTAGGPAPPPCPAASPLSPGPALRPGGRAERLRAPTGTDRLRCLQGPPAPASRARPLGDCGGKVLTGHAVKPIKAPLHGTTLRHF